jgi:AcrR family transcriptional regulator
VHEAVKDRRVQKTQALLRQALAALMREKPYDDIVVKEILSRADVGRSTFYTHFADKNELLRSCVHAVLSAGSAHGRRTHHPHDRDILWFSVPIFDHIENHRRGGQPATSPPGRLAMHEHLAEAIMDLIEVDVTAALRASRSPSTTGSPELVTQWIASTFVLVLNWWVESGSALSAREAEGLFRSLVSPALTGMVSPSSATSR